MLAQRFLRSYFTHSFRLNIFPGASIPDSSGTEPIFSVSADGDRFAPTVRHLPERTPSSAAYRKRRTLSPNTVGCGTRTRSIPLRPQKRPEAASVGRHIFLHRTGSRPTTPLCPDLPAAESFGLAFRTTQSSEVFLHILDMLARFLVKFVVKHCDARDDEKHRNNQVRIMTVVQAPNDIDRKPHDRSQHKNQRDGRRLLVKLCVLLFIASRFMVKRFSFAFLPLPLPAPVIQDKGRQTPAERQH